MGCKSMLVGRLMGVGMRRLHGVQGTLGLWALRSVLLGSCYKEEMETWVVYGSSMSILQDENGMHGFGRARSDCMHGVYGSEYLSSRLTTVLIDERSYAR